MNYQIVTGTSPYNLELMVADAIKKGWVPCGGVSSVTFKTEQGVMFIQAMTLTGK